MANEVKLPRLGQGMESGTIVKWLKSEGDRVEKGEPLYELDTDKVTQEVEAEASGVLLKIAVQEGEVPVGETIAVIGEEGEEAPDLSSASNGSAAQEVEEDSKEEGSPAPAREEERERGRRASSGAREQIAEARQPEPVRDGGRVKASPLARRIARERGIDLAALSGTGPEGRIVAEDVERVEAGAAVAEAPAAPAAVAPPSGEVEVEQLSSVRRTIARRLTEAWQAPAFQISMSADMTRAQELHARLAELAGDGPEADADRHPHEGERRRADAPPRRQRTLHRRGDRALPERRHRPRGRDPRRARRARDPRQRPPHDRRDRRSPDRPGAASPRRQAQGRRPRGRHLHDLQPRHVRRRAVRRRAQPAAGRDPRGRRRSRIGPSPATARSSCGR